MLTNEQLTNLSTGELSFDTFATQASGDFTALATRITKRWKELPTTVDVDDLVQVMLLAVHINLIKHDSARSSIRDFIVGRCCYAARDEITRAVKSKSHDEKMHLVNDVQEPRQEEAHLACELRNLLPRDERQRYIMDALTRTGSLDGTANALLAHPATVQMFVSSARRPVTKPSDNTRRRVRRSIYLTARKFAARAQAHA